VAIDVLNRIHELQQVKKRAREAVAGKEPSIVTGLRATIIINVDSIHAEYHQRRQRESLPILAGIQRRFLKPFHAAFGADFLNRQRPN